MVAWLLELVSFRDVKNSRMSPSKQTTPVLPVHLDGRTTPFPFSLILKCTKKSPFSPPHLLRRGPPHCTISFTHPYSPFLSTLTTSTLHSLTSSPKLSSVLPLHVFFPCFVSLPALPVSTGGRMTKKSATDRDHEYMHRQCRSA